jgi:hypothetical protein
MTDSGANGEPKKMNKLEPVSSSKAGNVSASLDKDANRAPVAEFLYQLIKMLEDDNKEIIEWSEGRIKVHHPERLEAEILSRYFRHSKFASFQRQLNYFGFRKIAGKGKMSPCSYVNDSASHDIRSLLNIKRKTNGSAARKAALRQAMMSNATSNLGGLPLLNPALLNGLQGMPGASGLDLLALRQIQELQQLAQRQQQQQQQSEQQRSLGEGLFFPSENALNALIAAGQQGQSSGGLARLSATASGLSALSGAPIHPGLGGAPGSAAPMPATAAAAALGQESGNLGESNANLDSFVNDQSAPNKKPSTPRGVPPRLASSQSLLNRLPSSNTIFPDNLSTVSLTNLMQGGMSANRLSSMLSLSGLMSREQSLADLLAGGSAAHLAGAGQLPLPLASTSMPLMQQSLAAFAPVPSPPSKNPSRSSRGGGGGGGGPGQP